MRYTKQLGLIGNSIQRHQSDLVNRKNLMEGYETLRKVIQFCFNRTQKPSFFQRAVLRCDFRANLPLCFTYDVWNICSSEILVSLGLPYVKSSVMITAPRRFGKTKARSLISAANMLYCHNPLSPIQMMISYVFSQTMDSSERFLLETGNWLKDYMQSVGDSCQYIIDIGVRKITVTSRTNKSKGAVMHAAPGHGEVSHLSNSFFIIGRSWRHCHYGPITTTTTTILTTTQTRRYMIKKKSGMYVYVYIYCMYVYLSIGACLVGCYCSRFLVRKSMSTAVSFNSNPTLIYPLWSLVLSGAPPNL